MDKKCPLLKRKCLRDGCEMWVAVPVKPKNTGETVKWDCAIKLQHLIALKNWQLLDGLEQTLETFRNEMASVQRSIAATFERAEQRIAQRRDRQLT